jgi:hypothetical protein
MKAALKQMAREDARLNELVDNYQVRKWYRQNQTGPLPRWMKPIKCLCKVPHYSRGYTSPCNRWVCTDYVKRERKYQLRNSDVMTERKKNANYWRMMMKTKDTRVSLYAKKHGIALDKAKFEVELLDAVEKAEADAIWEDAAFYIPKTEEE